MCRDLNGRVIEHRQRRRLLAFTQNDLLGQYFVILICHIEELTSSQFRSILGQVVSMVLRLILIASRVFWGGCSLATTDGLLAPTVRTLIVIPASYVVWFHGKERDTANGIMV